MFVSCVHRRVVEGSGVCMLMSWGVSYVVGGCNVVAILSMADMACLECRNCGVHELGLYGMLE